jgi:hypothetical protein
VANTFADYQDLKEMNLIIGMWKPVTPTLLAAHVKADHGWYFPYLPIRRLLTPFGSCKFGVDLAASSLMDVL